MRKSVFYFVFGIAIVTLVLIFGKVVRNDNKVTYKSVTECGLVFDVPDNYSRANSELRDINSELVDSITYYNFSGDFIINIFELNDIYISVEDSINKVREAVISGNVESDAYFFKVENDYISKRRVRQYGVEDINGIEMGYITVSYDVSEKNKTINITEKMYSMATEDKMIQIVFMSKRADQDKYGEIADYVINSVIIK